MLAEQPWFESRNHAWKAFSDFLSFYSSKDTFFFPLDRSSVCDEPGERDDKLPKTVGLVREPTLQTEGESLSRHALSGVSVDLLAICNQ